MVTCRVILAIAATSIISSACSYLNDKMGLEDDNLLEESAEAVIEHHTGLDIDLTPKSDE